MADFSPSDDAILIAASNLAAAVIDLRRGELTKPKVDSGAPDFAKQENHASNLLGWAIDQVKTQAEKR